ncbi:SCO family protein [Fredinandcohnia humi]
MRNSIGIMMSIFVGFAILWIGTDGFQAFTAESARFLTLEREKPSLPSATFIDSDGEKFTVQDVTGKYVLITFMFTSCGDVCPVLERNFAEIYENIPRHVLGKDVVLLSISFDPEKDTPATLKTYSEYFGADGELWKMVTIQDQEQLSKLLESLEVIVIPNEFGGYEHNSAFYLVAPDGRLTNIFDYQSPQSVVEYLDSFLF